MTRLLPRTPDDVTIAQSQRRTVAILDSLPECIVTLEAGGRVIAFNAAAARTFGYPKDQAIGRLLGELIVRPLHREAFAADMARHLGDGAPPPIATAIEIAAMRSDGSELLVELTLTAIDADTPPIFTGVLRDVTGRQRTETDVRAAEERMRFALQSVNVGVWNMDYVTGVLEWSEIVESQYGLRPGTFGGTFEAFMERVHPDDRASLLDTLDRATQSGRDFSMENRALWPDGTVRWLHGAGRIILGDDGAPVRGVGISLDLTEQRVLQAQFAQAQKMEAMGLLAGGVAHDFNNLLTIILGNCELALEEIGPTEGCRSTLEEIQTAGMSAAALTRQLLALSRKEMIEPTLLDLNVVLAGMRAMLRRLIREDVQIVLSLHPDLAPVKADHGQMEQIVLNLAVNARDAMPTGGTLTIEIANVELDDAYARTHRGATPGPYVALAVTDTGSGMTPDVQARLFEPFFTTKPVGKGTGLGLATVHGIVTQSGGSIDVSSQAGTGTSFRVYLPRVDPAGLGREAPAPISRSMAGHETVLLVEDADGLRLLATRLLERLGYTVLVAANADQALQVFDAHPSIAVVLTDVVMPGGSGPDLTKRLMERRPGLPVIYMSGYTDETIAHHGVLDPGIAFLHKPFTSESLGRKVRDVLDRSSSDATM